MLLLNGTPALRKDSTTLARRVIPLSAIATDSPAPPPLMYAHHYISSYNLLSVFCICNIMTCILDNAGHVIVGFTMPTSEARLALFTLIMKKKVLI